MDDREALHRLTNCLSSRDMELVMAGQGIVVGDYNFGRAACDRAVLQAQATAKYYYDRTATDAVFNQRIIHEQRLNARYYRKARYLAGVEPLGSAGIAERKEAQQ